MKNLAALLNLARTSVFVLAALVMGGCGDIAAVVKPDAAPGGDYYEGYMAGTQFIEDGYQGVGVAARWFKRYSLTETDAAIQKALMVLPPVIVENHSPVWIEAFRAGAETRFDQISAYSLRRSIPGKVLIVVSVLAIGGLLSYLRVTQP
jgi:hypothetical protein